MTPAARRRALRAAAAVAALGAAGCAPKQPAPPAPAAAEPAAAVAPAEAEPEAPAIEVCLAAADKAAEEGRIEDELECCRSIAEHFDEAMARGETVDMFHGWPSRTQCCDALGWGPGLACTPWGPPTPPTDAPALRRGPLDLRAEARGLTVDVLVPPDGLRQAAIGTWRARMEQEYGSADVFAALARQLAAAGAPADAVAEIAAFAGEERRHGVLCGAVVAALGGEPVGELPPAPPFPRHPEVDPLEGALRNLLSICCLSETVAVALIGAEREDMPQGALRELLTTIWADEVGHARAGWRLLAELLPLGDPGLPGRLADWMPTALAHLEAHELAHLPVDATFGPEAAPWGLCSGRAARALFHETVEHVIVPALREHGIA